MRARESGSTILPFVLCALRSRGEATSEWPVTLDQHALHDTALAHRIVDVDAVHRGPVVPHHAVADRPLMAEMVPGLARFGRELVEQRVALGPLKAEDAVEPVEVEVERLAAGVRMRTHQWMLDVGRLGDLPRGARRRPVAGARGVVGMDRALAVDALAGRFRQRLVDGVHVAEPGAAAAA